MNSVKSILIVTVSFLVLSCSTDKKSKPKIIFIYADGRGLGDLSMHGSAFCETPNLDKMAEEGTNRRVTGLISGKIQVFRKVTGGCS